MYVNCVKLIIYLRWPPCIGMLKLMQGGFPHRAHFNDLYQKYKTILPAKLARLDPRLFCESLFRAVGMKHEDFRFGMSRVLILYFFNSWKGLCVHFITGNKVSPILAVKYIT